MPTTDDVVRAPWTCTWGRFGGPVNARDEVSPGFAFWVCGHPQTEGPRLLERNDCAACRRWAADDPPIGASAA